MRSLKRMLSIGMALSFLGVLAACGNNNIVAGKPQSGATLDPKDLFYGNVEPAEETHGLQVRLKWNTGEETPLLWNLTRWTEGDSSDKREHIVIDGKAMEYVDTEVLPGKKYSYILVAQAPFRFGLATDVEVPVGKTTTPATPVPQKVVKQGPTDADEELALPEEP